MIKQPELEKCANLLLGDLHILESDKVLAIITFGQRELYTLTLGCNAHPSALIRQQSQTGAADLEVAFFCDCIEFAENPYGGSKEAIQFWDNARNQLSLTLVPIAEDRRYIWVALNDEHRIESSKE